MGGEGELSAIDIMAARFIVQQTLDLLYQDEEVDSDLEQSRETMKKTYYDYSPMCYLAIANRAVVKYYKDEILGLGQD